jgi:hypothetical protein
MRLINRIQLFSDIKVTNKKEYNVLS